MLVNDAFGWGGVGGGGRERHRAGSEGDPILAMENLKITLRL